MVKKIVNLTKTLARFPHAGRNVPEFGDENIRELMAYRYRIMYRLQDQAVVIAAMIHGKRILQKREGNLIGTTILYLGIGAIRANPWQTSFLRA